MPGLICPLRPDLCDTWFEVKIRLNGQLKISIYFVGIQHSTMGFADEDSFLAFETVLVPQVKVSTFPTCHEQICQSNKRDRVWYWISVTNKASYLLCIRNFPIAHLAFERDLYVQSRDFFFMGGQTHICTRKVKLKSGWDPWPSCVRDEAKSIENCQAGNADAARDPRPTGTRSKKHPDARLGLGLDLTCWVV